MDLQTVQTGIVEDLPAHGSYLSFDLKAAADASLILASLKSLSGWAKSSQVTLGQGLVLGLGSQSLRVLNSEALDDLSFPGFSTAHHTGCIDVPSTPHALWIWLRGAHAGELLIHGQSVNDVLSDAFELSHVTYGFKHKEGRDLTGYEDGTENPVDEDAINAAYVQAKGPGLSGASYVAVQQWQHDLGHFKRLKQEHQDHIIGRRLSDNYELPDAPVSAHVKRTAQESFTPQAFMVRRSMPYRAELNGGLMFVCFAHSPLPFSQQLKRMVGLEDGITDGLFEFSQPLTGAYYWCPPMDNGEFDFQALL